jgi:DNA relaxase NicK
VDFASKRVAALLGEHRDASGHRFHNSFGMKFEDGALITFDADADSYAVVDLPAKAIERMGRAAFDLLAIDLLSRGGRCTRLDIALDFVGEGSGGRGLIDKVLSACKSREMCGAKTFKVTEGTSYTKGSLGRTVYLGKRGNCGSGRMARIYDKGIESKVCEEGEWTRFEVEFSGDVAEQAAIDLFKGGLEDRKLVSAAFGAFDFRAVTGRREKARRPRLDWWASLLAGAELISWRARRVLQDAAKWCDWVRRCVGRQLTAVADGMATDVGTVVGMICRGAEPSAFTRGGRGADVVSLLGGMLCPEPAS